MVNDRDAGVETEDVWPRGSRYDDDTERELGGDRDGGDGRWPSLARDEGYDMAAEICRA